MHIIFFHLRKPAGRSLVFSPVSIANLLGDHCLCHQSLLLHTCIQNHHVVCRDTSNVSLLMHNSIRKTLYCCATGEHDISFSIAAILQEKKKSKKKKGGTFVWTGCFVIQRTETAHTRTYKHTQLRVNRSNKGMFVFISHAYWSFWDQGAQASEAAWWVQGPAWWVQGPAPAVILTGWLKMF